MIYNNVFYNSSTADYSYCRELNEKIHTIFIYFTCIKFVIITVSKSSPIEAYCLPLYT